MHRYLLALGMGMVVLSLSGVAVPAAVTKDAGGLPAPGTGVRARPVTGTPHFPATTDPVQQVRQLVECGGTMYAVGTFSRIVRGSTTFSRSNIFSFRATPPFTVTSWAPHVNGTVNSIAFRGKGCSYAYIGGSFTSVNGTPVSNIAEISTRTGSVVGSFAHDASAQVETLLAVRRHLLVGGFYRKINGSSADPYMTSLNPTTGKDDGFVHLKISGHYRYRDASPNPTRIFNQALSHNRRFDLVMGDFTSVGGVTRHQIFMLGVDSRVAKVTGWNSTDFKGHCAKDPFYVRAASWSPDDSTIYVATTGYRPYNKLHYHVRTGLCDAAAAYPARHTSVKRKWINYTGCDSLYSTAADATTAYFAGHERWSMNNFGCNFAGRGAIPAMGMEGVSPANGDLYVNRSRTAGYYNRGRGYGADDMLITSAGLWIASDNFLSAQECGHIKDLAGICFLPYRSRAK